MDPYEQFWSLTLHNEEHFFEDNAIKRFSVGTKNRSLKTGADGSVRPSVLRCRGRLIFGHPFSAHQT